MNISEELIREIITKVVEMNEVNGEVIAEGVNAKDDENDKIKTY